MNWQYTDETQQVVFRALDGGGMESMLVSSPEIQQWIAAGNTPDPYVPPTPMPTTKFSALDYFARFTDAEYAAARSGPMAIQRGLDMLIAAQYVDVTDPRVAEYLSAMVAAGIIDDARKAELLAPPA